MLLHEFRKSTEYVFFKSNLSIFKKLTIIKKLKRFIKYYLIYKFNTNILKGKLYMEGTKITLKAPGSYKLDELKEICNTLGIDMKNADGKKKTKQQLYDDIIIKID